MKNNWLKNNWLILVTGLVIGIVAEMMLKRLVNIPF